MPRVLCETVEAKDVFSSNLVKLSRQESVHFVEHSGGGRREWFGPGVNVNQELSRNEGNGARSQALFITEKMMSCLNRTFSDGL